jgi:hypothetical protein
MMKSMFKTLFDIRQDHKKREHLNNLKALFKVLQLFLFSSPSLDPTLKAFENLSTINLQLVIISGEQKRAKSEPDKKECIKIAINPAPKQKRKNSSSDSSSEHKKFRF